ncbi:MAG: ECF RNA polymerase sigma factor SigW [Phycisphaerae bacterium]|nr:ECF RNA polymerase sigma factor SigW [Phycisphaerae bacterium]
MRPIVRRTETTEPNERDVGGVDAYLVRCAQRGDTSAFGQLVTKYQDRVFNTCYRMCHDHAEALDLAQSAFVKAYESLARFEGKSSFYTWMFRIAVNVVISSRRRRRTAMSLDQPGRGESGRREVAAAEEDVDANSVRDELRERLEAALERLPDEFRVVVVLKDVEGLDYAEIAEVIGAPIGTVKSRLHRGRSMLREWLTDSGESA